MYGSNGTDKLLPDDVYSVDVPKCFVDDWSPQIDIVPLFVVFNSECVWLSFV